MLLEFDFRNNIKMSLIFVRKEYGKLADQLFDNLHENCHKVVE